MCRPVCTAFGPTYSAAVEIFVTSLRQRSAPVNTVKSYAHDLRLFVRAVPADLSAVTPEDIQASYIGEKRRIRDAERKMRVENDLFACYIRNEIWYLALHKLC